MSGYPIDATGTLTPVLQLYPDETRPAGRGNDTIAPRIGPAPE